MGFSIDVALVIPVLGLLFMILTSFLNWVFGSFSGYGESVQQLKSSSKKKKILLDTPAVSQGCDFRETLVKHCEVVSRQTSRDESLLERSSLAMLSHELSL